MPRKTVPESGTARRRRRDAVKAPRVIALAIAAAVLAAAAWLVVARARTQVRWTAVMEAAGAASTINGVARVSGEDGSEWAYSFWCRVEGPGSFSPQGMLVPVKVAKGAKPSEQTVRIAQSVDYCGPEGIAAGLAAKRRSSRGRWARWGGGRALEVTVRASEVPWPGEDPRHEWRFYLDPRTRLVQGVEIFSAGTLLVHAEYRYNQPLPSGIGNRESAGGGQVGNGRSGSGRESRVGIRE